MRRAIRAEQKEARRRQIIDVAWRLFQEHNYEAVNMVDVAREVGLAKGTLYLYFGTKEALFLAVLTQRFAHWFATVNGRLQDLDAPATAETAAQLFGRSLAETPHLTRLFALLHVILEHNIDAETARTFKYMLLENVQQTGALLEAALPWLAAGEGAALLLRIYALVLGVQQMADPAAVVRDLQQAEADLHVFVIDFELTFVAILTDLLVGMEGNK